MLLGQITLFSLSSSGGVSYIYIQLYTYVCINCCLTVEPRYLEQFCHQKRCKRVQEPKYFQDSRFKIQKKLLESRNSPDPSPGIQEVFFGS